MNVDERLAGDHHRVSGFGWGWGAGLGDGGVGWGWVLLGGRRVGVRGRWPGVGWGWAGRGWGVDGAWGGMGLARLERGGLGGVRVHTFHRGTKITGCGSTVYLTFPWGLDFAPSCLCSRGVDFIFQRGFQCGGDLRDIT